MADQPAPREIPLLERLFYHVCLPRQLPGQESKGTQVDAALLHRFAEAAECLVSHAEPSFQSAVEALHHSILLAHALNVDGKPDSRRLAKKLSALGPNDSLILHIMEQNAALILYRQQREMREEVVVVECFEASAMAASVLKSKNALEWDLPGSAVAVPYSVFVNESFQSHLAEFIEKASVEQIPRFAAKSFKAQTTTREIRDTADPALITDLLLTVLEVNGEPWYPPVLRKRVRDDVIFKDAEKPWRRAPLYFIIRAATQRLLYRHLGPEIGRAHFKFFMCLFLSQLLDDSLHSLRPEAVHGLQTKLCRRLAKLERDKCNASSEEAETAISHLFARLGTCFRNSAGAAATLLESQWKRFQESTQRPISLLPAKADRRDMRLSLPSSFPYLRSVLSGSKSGSRLPALSPGTLDAYDEKACETKPVNLLAKRFFSLSKYEESVTSNVDGRASTARCIGLAKKLESYVQRLEGFPRGYPEMRSSQFLTLLELWVQLDRYALEIYPLLARFHPVFGPNIVDLLHLLTKDDMERACTIQVYLQARCKFEQRRIPPCKTIFANPTGDEAEGTFAACFFDESLEMQRVLEEIQKITEEERNRTERERERMNKEYKRLFEQISELDCTAYTYVDEYDGMVKEVHENCEKHKLQKIARRMSIQIFEYPLRPGNAAKLAVFELLVPEAFAWYRDATQLILSAFGGAKKSFEQPKVLLRDDKLLYQYENGATSHVTLASRTKRYTESHWKNARIPAELHEVAKPCGLKLEYYDTRSNAWIADHHASLDYSQGFPLSLPPGSPFIDVGPADPQRWPSSYDIMASQMKCPPSVNVHEFLAWQSLLCGSNMRWLSLLRELGSSSLNFSSESSWSIVTRLCLEQGPSDTDEECLRNAHMVFKDSSFCRSLLGQIEYRLEGLRRNWREIIVLDLLVTFLLRTAFLAPDRLVRGDCIKLLEKAREIAWEWRSQMDLLAVSGTGGSPEGQMFAALLVKRTFEIYPTLLPQIGPEALKIFIGGSVWLQDNLVRDFESLPYPLRNAVLRDLKLTWRIRTLLKDAILRNVTAVFSGLNDTWPIPVKNFEFALIPGDQWIEFSCTSSSQHIHYNFVSGHLLFNGRPLGSLPLEYTSLPIMVEIFGNTQNLKGYSSPLQDMEYAVACQLPYNHQIHVGKRGGTHIVRATQDNSKLLEFLPKDIFGPLEPRKLDLPAALIFDCYHWINVTTGIIEVRKGEIWKTKDSNWQVDVEARLAKRRPGTKREATLVDPRSQLFDLIEHNLHYFESADHIMAFQPMNGSLSLELKRMELNMTVNPRGLLTVRQLQAEIFRFQNVGTYYGLYSKLVVRSLRNKRQRSIIIPIGKPQVYAQPSGNVKVVIETEMTRPSVAYFVLQVNDVLGRLDCNAVPIIMYLRAYYHAVTSHFLPDPLTKRTGVQESLTLLQSSGHQPWEPLGEPSMAILDQIAALSPHREYYPRSLKCMETVAWNPRLMVVTQDDRFEPVADAIKTRSRQLSRFVIKSRAIESAISSKTRNREDRGDNHLRMRAVSKQRGFTPGEDQQYDSRDLPLRSSLTVERGNVFETVALLKQWPDRVELVKNIGPRLEKFNVIGGYNRVFKNGSLIDLLSMNLGVEWGALSTTAMQSNRDDCYKLMFLFAPICFASDIDMDLVRLLISLALVKDVRLVMPPTSPSFVGYKSDTPSPADIVKIIEKARVPYSPEGKNKELHSKQRGLLALARIDHEKRSRILCEYIGEALLRRHWPRPSFYVDFPVDSELVNVGEAIELLTPEWSKWSKNHTLNSYLDRVQLILSLHSPLPDQVSILATLSAIRGRREDSIHLDIDVYPSRRRGNGYPPSLVELVSMSAIPEFIGARVGKETKSDPAQQASTMSASLDRTESPELTELRAMTSFLRDSDSPVQRNYAEQLDMSITSLAKFLSEPENWNKVLPSEADLIKMIDSARRFLQANHEVICKSLQQPDSSMGWLLLSGDGPSMTFTELLSTLRSTEKNRFGIGVKEALVSLGVNITSLQRLLRLQDSRRKGKPQQTIDELKNTGHENWDPFIEYPDWLLLEVDSNVLIRKEQVLVAKATINPTTGANSTTQLLMGAGKSSIILPLVASVLANADTRNLFRVVVPRALLQQSAQVLLLKLGGLVGRELIHIPFSRRTPTDGCLMSVFKTFLTDAQSRSAVVLALPEHLLSFRLSGIQCLSDGKLEDAQDMMRTQKWLDVHSRDVLDECDIALSVRTQLIYPSGAQMAVDGHPLRWQVIETVLHLVSFHLEYIQERWPLSIEVVRRANTEFPLVFFLRKDAEDALLQTISSEVSEGMSVLPCSEFTITERQAIRSFISSEKVGTESVQIVKKLFAGDNHLLKMAYLLRGLFTHRLLVLTLNKRWNVQYGLHPDRVSIAVPFLSKGVPSPTAEFGHPDVSIILTCLSFYYGGLNLDQFKQAFQELLKSNEPSVEYDRWTSTVDLPEHLRDFNSINADDTSQLSGLFAHIRYNIHLANFFMNNFVFPKHATQFQKKLCGSGWDLVHLDPSVKKQRVRTTGFSGTNDFRSMLPLTITQNDLPSLQHTNALVLQYLLSSRNREYRPMTDEDGTRLSETGLLRKLCHSGIRVLLDAGAQILELDNVSLVKTWLSIDTEAVGAVYFHQVNNEAFFIYRKGLIIPLLASPFAENLENCVIYVDEAHCRGIDLKLPAEARAGMTLGPHLTKDALVQAAMRLRLLGHSQSVLFLSPPEVHHRILEVMHKSVTSMIDSFDVLCWVMSETTVALEHLEPLFYSQGMEYARRVQGAVDYPDLFFSKNHRFNPEWAQRKFLEVVKTDEMQTLAQLYSPKHSKRAVESRAESFASALQAFLKELWRRRKAFQDHGVAVHSSALEEVEQEREIEVEVENVREVQRQILYAPLKFPGLRKDIKHFLDTGRLPTSSNAYDLMLHTMAKTAVGQKHRVNSNIASGRLFISKEFSRTVDIPRSELKDDFQRPVQFLLYSTLTDTAMIINPEEADIAIPILRQRPAGNVYLLVYSAPVTRRMLHFNNLDFYSVPTLPVGFSSPIWLRVLVGIFAGRLYFEWTEYDEIMRFLGGRDPVDRSDGPLAPSKPSLLAKKPLTFLHDYLSVKRKGQDYENTPMGFVTTGKPLHQDMVFFRSLDARAPGNRGESRRAAKGDEVKAQEFQPGSDSEDEFFDAEEGVSGSDKDDDDDEAPVITTRNIFFDDEYPAAAPELGR